MQEIKIEWTVAPREWFGGEGYCNVQSFFPAIKLKIIGASLPFRNNHNLYWMHISLLKAARHHEMNLKQNPIFFSFISFKTFTYLNLHRGRSWCWSSLCWFCFASASCCSTLSCCRPSWKTPSSVDSGGHHQELQKAAVIIVQCVSL